MPNGNGSERIRKRIAVVLVPGVGEEGAGETSGAVSRGLVAAGLGYPSGKADTVAIPVAGVPGHREAFYQADRLRLTRPVEGSHSGRVDQVDLVEMRWSDISRFPKKGLLAFFATLFALGLQLGTPGMEVTRGGATWAQLAPGDSWLARRRRPTNSAAAANMAMNLASWWLATVMVPLTVVLGLLATALWLIVDDSLSLSHWFVLLVVGIAGAVAVWLLGAGIAAGGWDYGGKLTHPRWWAFVPFVGAVGLAIQQGVATGSIKAGLGRTTLGVGIVGLRAAWLVSLGLVGLSLLLLTLWRLRSARTWTEPERRTGPRGFYTAVLTTTLSPLIVAVLGAVLIGGIGTIAFQSARDSTWERDVAELRCVSSASSWRLTDQCGSEPAAWPQVSRSVEARLEEAENHERIARDQRRRAVKSESQTLRGKLAGFAEASDTRARTVRDTVEAAERDAVVTPVAWASSLLGIIILPLFVTVVGAALYALGIAATVISVRGERSTGRLLTRTIQILRSRWTGWLLVGVAIALGLATTYLWTGFFVWDLPDRVDAVAGAGRPGTAEKAGIGSAAVLILLSIARFAPVDPRRWRDTVGGGLAKLRSFADRGYDAATYLRRDRRRVNPSEEKGIRTATVARFRAIVRHLEDRYDAVVVAGHSQGSMYAIATLFGDEARFEKEIGPDGKPSTWGVLPWVQAYPDSTLGPKPVGLLTFGCPFRQTHAERLPGQYAWLDPIDPTRLAPLSVAWVNAYRARDFVGRSIFVDYVEEPSPQGTAAVLTLPVGAATVDLMDVCLHGRRTHMGYWDDPELALWLDFLVRATLVSLRDPSQGRPDPPSGYTIADRAKSSAFPRRATPGSRVPPSGPPEA